MMPAFVILSGTGCVTHLYFHIAIQLPSAGPGYKLSMLSRIPGVEVCDVRPDKSIRTGNGSLIYRRTMTQ